MDFYVRYIIMAQFHNLNGAMLLQGVPLGPRNRPYGRVPLLDELLDTRALDHRLEVGRDHLLPLVVG